jgi:polysaccharide export outer membrane protein
MKWMTALDSLDAADRIRSMSFIISGYIHSLYRKGGKCTLITLLLLIIGCATTDPQPEVQNVEKIGAVSVSEFTLGPGDVIDVYVWKYEDLSQKIRVDPYGKIHYPFVGEIDVTGKSVNTVRDLIAKGLSRYYVNPIVKVSVDSIASQKVFVLGEVQSPGVFPIDTPINVLDAIARSEGFTRDADQKKIILIRRNPEQIEIQSIDIKSLLETGDKGQMVALQKDDIIYVPPSFMANVDRFFEHVAKIIYPIAEIERAFLLGDEIWNVLQGKGRQRTIILSP